MPPNIPMQFNWFTKSLGKWWSSSKSWNLHNLFMLLLWNWAKTRNLQNSRRYESYHLTRRLSGFQTLNDATAIVQKWLVLRLFAYILHLLNFLKNMNDNFLLFLLKFEITINVKIISLLWSVSWRETISAEYFLLFI